MARASYQSQGSKSPSAELMMTCFKNTQITWGLADHRNHRDFQSQINTVFRNLLCFPDSALHQ